MSQAKTFSKVQINAVLKDLGIGFIKASTGDFNSKDVVLKDRNKGLRGGSMGPLTCTDAHHDVSARVQKEVREAFEKMGAYVRIDTCYAGATHKLYNLHIELPLDEKKVRVLKFYWRAFSTYTAAARLDRDYATYWFVMEATDCKVSELEHAV